MMTLKLSDRTSVFMIGNDLMPDRFRSLRRRLFSRLLTDGMRFMRQLMSHAGRIHDK